MGKDLHQLPRFKTGIEGLDYILGGGFPSRRSYLIQGEPGAGKTTLGLQFLLEGVKAGQKGLYVTLSETKQELEQVAESHGWTLADIAILDLTMLEKYKPSDTTTTLFHPYEVELNEITKIIMQELENLRPDRLIFDSLSEMRMLTENPLRYRKQMLSLKQFFTRQNCTVLMLDDKTSSVRDLQINSIAHGVIDLRQFSPEFGAERRVLNILKVRGVPFKGGNHDFVIRRGGVVVFPRLVASDHSLRGKRRKIKSGLKNLDLLLDGGVDSGTSTLFIGPAGSGKSTLTMQYAAAAADRGENVLVFIFDETQELLLDRSEALGIPLKSHVKSGRIKIVHVDPAEMSPGELSDIVKQAVIEEGIKFVVLDSLNGYINSMPEERFLILHLHELMTFLSRKGATAFMVLAQHGLLGPMQTPADLTYLADTVILLRYFESEGQIRQAISVMKKRSGHHERMIRELKIDKEGITIGEPLSQFHGILTGTPVYQGKSGNYLLNGISNAKGR